METKFLQRTYYPKRNQSVMIIDLEKLQRVAVSASMDVYHNDPFEKEIEVTTKQGFLLRSSSGY